MVEAKEKFWTSLPIFVGTPTVDVANQDDQDDKKNMSYAFHVLVNVFTHIPSTPNTHKYLCGYC